jgi:hypothetical protein
VPPLPVVVVVVVVEPLEVVVVVFVCAWTTVPFASQAASDRLNRTPQPHQHLTNLMVAPWFMNAYTPCFHSP